MITIAYFICCNSIRKKSYGRIFHELTRTLPSFFFWFFIYLLPFRVGFSYSDDPDNDYGADDASAATDNYFLIQGFLQRFPHFAESAIYGTSESYGGALFFPP